MNTAKKKNFKLYEVLLKPRWQGPNDAEGPKPEPQRSDVSSVEQEKLLYYLVMKFVSQQAE
jgi:hypothetical protein